MCTLYSRKYEAMRSALQPSGVGETANWVGSGRLLERAGRVAVRAGDAAVDLGHLDDVDRSS